MKSWIWVAATVIIFGGIGVFAFNGFYARPLPDDYCETAKIIGQDPISTTLHWYNSVSGRLTQFLILIPIMRAGMPFAMISPLLILIVWVAVWAWALHPLLKRVGGTWRESVIAAGITIFPALAGSPQIEQSLYWVQGAYTYIAPLLGIALIGGIVARIRTVSIPLIGGVFALALINGLYAEPTTTFQAAIFGLVFLAAWRWKWGSGVRWTAFAAGVGTAAALVILLLSPGNAIRSSSYIPSPSIAATFIDSILYSVVFLVGAASRFAPLALLMAFALPMIWSAHRPPAEEQRHIGRRIGWLSVALLLTLVAFMIPGVYATSAPPPARSFIIPLFTLASVLVMMGVIVGESLRRSASNRRLAAVTVVGFALLGVIPYALNAARLSSVYIQYAVESDARDALLRQAADQGVRVAVVPPLTVDIAAATGLDTVGANPRLNLGDCVGRFYGLDNIQVSGDPSIAELTSVGSSVQNDEGTDP